MRLILQDDYELITLQLPKERNGNYWLNDRNKDNVVNIIARDNKWFLCSNEDYKILKDKNSNENELLTNVNQLNEVELVDFLKIYLFDINKKIVKSVYVFPTYDNTFIQLGIDGVNEVTIGKNNSLINCNIESFDKNQVIIIKENGNLRINNNNIKVSMFINNIEEKEKFLNNGDMVFIDGLMFTILGNILMINNPNNVVTFDSLKLVKRLLPTNPVRDYTSVQETFVEYFNNSDYFQRPPRFKRSIEEKEFIIDPPTQNQNPDEMPLIYTIGPMMLMGVTSLMSGLTAIMNVIEGKANFKDNATPIITTLVMMGSTVFFPLMQKLYQKKTKAGKERKRRRKYKKYIDKKKNDILQEIEIQRQILIENNLDIENTARVILNKQRTLWDRKIEHADFLNVRLGIGTVKPKIKVEVPEEHFTMDEDDLRDLYEDLFTSIKDIDNVPVVVDFVEKQYTGIVGEYNYVKKFLDGFMLKILASHSYDMLKIVVISSREKSDTWYKYRNIPHFWDNEKSIRYIGFELDDISKISNNLIQIFNERFEKLKEDENKVENNNLYKNYKEYYLVISDEIEYIKSTSIFNELIKQDNNLGFSFVFVTDTLDKLPNECSTFINLSSSGSDIFENELISTKQKSFIPDMCNINLNSCYISLCNIPIDIAAGKFILPTNYSFLEMYDVGNVNQLNILNRWKNNNITKSLAVPVGINEQGELFKIDLHEKAHGPHGLVAGMTGSGKSEWIIGYILSMCINFHPDEVQFVLIDYKGGGLAGTFENKETGVKIPHLAGTITNLDVSEINRSLVSINSELKRRQSLFNQARDKLGESSIDIYKYQRLYRENKVDEPISHLFIISDEFAELKAQQPEFMAELISTARIGRSLGVHLILATQKPSGVVDDQIWSNSKFRVCLKVQDKSDSNDMIRVPDAAMIKEVGRFYLQVGYNELFLKGQAAYAGGPYYESDRHKKTVNTDLVFINDIGEVYKEINSEKKTNNAVYKGEELTNILKEIITVGNTLPNKSKSLWLEAIPENIYIDELLKKYTYNKINFDINPIIGEYDAPKYQRQDLLTLPITKNGNTLIYGIAGSGKEMLLTTILYSLMISYHYQELNVYVMDFGSEIFNCFKNAPIVGDIISGNSDEKIENAFKFFVKEFENRKKIFQDFGGNYFNYIKSSGKILPVILIILNNYENFSDLYEFKYNDILVKLTREAEKYGIYFIISASGHNSVKFKLVQNFKQSICLQLKENYDYRMVLGGHFKLMPKAYKGRGLVNIDNEVYEFQTANPVNTNNLNDYISSIALQLLEKQGGKAKDIQILPDVVDYEYVKNHINDLTDIPIGVNTESLEVAKFDFLTNDFNVITSTDNDSCVSFTSSIIEIIASKKETLKAILVDGMNSYDKPRSNVTYINDNYYGCFLSFIKFLDDITEKTKRTVFIISGLNKILDSNPKCREALNVIFKKVQGIEKVSVLLVENVKNLNTLKNNSLVNDFISFNNVIFVGDGINKQFIVDIKSGVSRNEKELPSNFGYVINKGKATKIKVVELFKEKV